MGLGVNPQDWTDGGILLFGPPRKAADGPVMLRLVQVLLRLARRDALRKASARAG